MLIAIVSDIHGNRQAFEAVLDSIAESRCEEMWCLGDPRRAGRRRRRRYSRAHATLPA